MERAAAEAERQSRLARRRPLAREARDLEARVATLEAERGELEAQLGDPAFYSGGDAAAIQRATRRATEVAREIEEAESRWLDLQSQLDEIGSD